MFEFIDANGADLGLIAFLVGVYILTMTMGRA
jgi:hypothetical protein